MKKLLVIASFAIFCGLVANAQCENKCPARPCDNAGPQVSCHKNVEHKIDRMKKSLSLNEKQCNELTKMFSDFEKESQKLRQEHRKEMQEHRERLDKSIEKILTADQFKAYSEKREKANCRPCPPDGPRHHGKVGKCPDRHNKTRHCEQRPKCCHEVQPQCCPKN